MSGGVSATTTGPNATQQMNASHSARRYFSIHSGTEQIPATEPTSDVALRLNPRVWVGRALYAFKSQFPFWPHEWRHPTPVSPVRATVKRLFIGSAPDALLSAPVQLKWPICDLFLQHAQVVRAVAKRAHKGDVKSDHTGFINA
jgi:hypothetical protein